MTELTVNGTVVDGAGYPSSEAAVIHELLRQHAVALGLISESMAGDDAIERAIEDVLDREVVAPAPGYDECLRYYEGHQEEFTSGELVFARHILFQVTPGGPIPALRARAELLLAELMRAPGDFDRAARENSNCPSGAHGGHLGHLARGDSVPEFERALFNGGYLGIYPQLVKTRFGFHILAVDRREPGKLVPFEVVREQIASRLRESIQRVALAHYVRKLALTAEITGADLCTDRGISPSLEEPTDSRHAL